MPDDPDHVSEQSFENKKLRSSVTDYNFNVSQFPLDQLKVFPEKHEFDVLLFFTMSQKKMFVIVALRTIAPVEMGYCK